MATFRDLIAIAKQDYFKDRVLFCLEKAAIAVMAEDPGTTGHATRKTYAGLVLAGQANLQEYAIGVVTNSTISGEANAGNPPDFSIPDSDIEFVVNSLFNAYAGV